MLLAPDECLGGVFGEVRVDVLPVFAPASDRMSFQLAEDVPLIRLVRLHELASRPSLHSLVQGGPLIFVLFVPVILWREPLTLIAVIGKHAVVAVVGVYPVDDASGLNDEDRCGCAVIMHASTNAVMAKAGHEVGPGRSIQVVAGRKVRRGLGGLVFCRHGESLPGHARWGVRAKLVIVYTTWL